MNSASDIAQTRHHQSALPDIIRFATVKGTEPSMIVSDNSEFQNDNSTLILIVGAGGHGQVVADILLRMQDAGTAPKHLAFIDDDPSLFRMSVMNLPVIGNTQSLPHIEHSALIIAIGDNKKRAQLFKELNPSAGKFIIACHPKAVIAPDAQIGEGTMICAGVVVNTQAHIGKNVILNTGCTVDHHNHIGDHTHIAPGAHLGGDVLIGEGTLVGIGATVMPGRKVGPWSVIGAGSLVHKDIPGGTVVRGVPARKVR